MAHSLRIWLFSQHFCLSWMAVSMAAPLLSIAARPLCPMRPACALHTAHVLQESACKTEALFSKETRANLTTDQRLLYFSQSLEWLCWTHMPQSWGQRGKFIKRRCFPISQSTKTCAETSLSLVCFLISKRATACVGGEGGSYASLWELRGPRARNDTCSAFQSDMAMNSSYFPLRAHGDLTLLNTSYLIVLEVKENKKNLLKKI